MPAFRHAPNFTLRIASAGLLLLVAALQGCDRGVDSGATANPVAPGRPGNARVEEVSPIPGSPTRSPQVGGARERVPEGVTGSGGTTDYPGELQGRTHVPRHPGVGIDGGLSDRPAPMDEDGKRMGAGPSGSTNRTSDGAVGLR